MNAAIDHLKPGRAVRAKRKLIVQQCVRSHLTAVQIPSPTLCGFHQFLAGPGAPKTLPHKPTLNETHWSRRLASVGMRPQTYLDKSRQLSISSGRNKECAWQRSARTRSYQILCVTQVFPHITFRP